MSLLACAPFVVALRVGLLAVSFTAPRIPPGVDTKKSTPAAAVAPAAAKVQGPSSIAAKAAEAAWKEWADKHNYAFTWSKDERVLVMLPTERSRPERALELMEKSLKRFDEMLPPPPPPPAPPPKPVDDTDVPPPSDGDNPPSEDPRAPTAAPAANGKTAGTWVWGAGDHPLDSDTIVFGLFRKPDDFADALDKVAKGFPFLAPWAAKAKEDPGCLLLQPLFGGCVDRVNGMEEWNPDNELVHRVAVLAMYRRFGHEPFWVGLGVGWNVEFDVLKSIYCFPYRNSFVWAKEHGGWEADLRRVYGKRGKKQPLTVDELAELKRGSFDLDGAARSWGTVRFLADAYPKQLSPLLADFQRLRDKLGRKMDPGASEAWASWKIPADFELAAADQKGVIEGDLAKDVLDQASAYFRDGKDWKKNYFKK
jgi:hypothetical protein